METLHPLTPPHFRSQDVGQPGKLCGPHSIGSASSTFQHPQKMPHQFPLLHMASQITLISPGNWGSLTSPSPHSIRQLVLKRPKDHLYFPPLRGTGLWGMWGTRQIASGWNPWKSQQLLQELLVPAQGQRGYFQRGARKSFFPLPPGPEARAASFFEESSQELVKWPAEEVPSEGPGWEEKWLSSAHPLSVPPKPSLPPKQASW